VANGIGQRLREARAARDIALEDIAEQTKIRAGFLRALEEERWDALPGAAYARSFLHTYAEFLGLDADAVVAEYRSQRELQEAEPEPVSVRQIRVAGQAPGRLPAELASPPRGGLRRWRWPIAAGAVAAVLALILVLGLVGGSDDGEDGAGEATGAGGREEGAGGGSSGGPGEGPAPARERPEVTLRLTATGTVWVCVVNQNDQPVVEGVTLPAGEERGPFRGRAFDVGLGNGQVEIEANDEPVEIPAAADPLGYRITPSGTSELDAAERPTCT